jgi:mono/diheme cytochrome c family protein
MLRIAFVVALSGAALLIAGVVATGPRPLAEDALTGLVPNAEQGSVIFAAAGCASCHTAKDGPADVMAGGKAFASDFGTFFAPNISSDPLQGVGSWSNLDLASAITRGVRPDSSHLYPAFPYAAYNKADLQDVVDLIAHLQNLPADPTPNKTHDLSFPFNIRAALGVWKLLFIRDDWVLATAETPQIARGRYLAEALAHCGECHTPRNILGGLERTAWLAGAQNPSGEGRTPNITSGKLEWSQADIAEYLSSGFTPDFDTAGGAMAEVVKNTALLSNSDRAAIAAYVKAVPEQP